MYHDPYSDAIRTLTLLKKLAAAIDPYKDERLKDLWKEPLLWDRDEFEMRDSYFESLLRSLPHSPTKEYVQLLPRLYRRDVLFDDKLFQSLNKHGYASVGHALKGLSFRNVTIVNDLGETVATVPAANFLAPFLLSDRIIESIREDFDPVKDRAIVETLNTIVANRREMIRLTLDHLRKKYLTNLRSAPLDQNKLRTIIHRIYNAEAQLSEQEIREVWDVASAVIRRGHKAAQRFASMVEYLLIERILDLDAQGKDIEPLVKLIAHGYNSLSQDEKQALQILAEEKVSEIAQEQPGVSNQINLNDPYYITTLAIGIPLTLLGIGLLATRFSGVGTLLLLPGLFSLFAAALGKENVQRIFTFSPAEQTSPIISSEEKDLLLDTYVKNDILSVGPSEFRRYVGLNQYRGDWQGVGEAFVDLIAFVLYHRDSKDLNDFLSVVQKLSKDVNVDTLSKNITYYVDQLVFGFECIWNVLSDQTKRNILDNETIREIENRGRISLPQVPIRRLKFDHRWLYSPRFRVKFGRLLGQIIENFEKNAPAAAGFPPALVGLVEFMSDIPLLGSAIRSAIPGIVQYRQAYQAVETLKSLFDMEMWNRNPTLSQLLYTIDWGNIDKLQNALQSGGQP